jgi:hypothetical protein
MWGEVEPLFPLHYAELALDKDLAKLNHDNDKYAEGERLGVLFIVTARHDGKLVGYYFGLLMNHLHYKDAGLMCYTDAYFILPEFRKGSAGIQFFEAIIDALKARGVVKLYATTKVHMDLSPLFERLGGRFTDKLYTWLL